MKAPEFIAFNLKNFIGDLPRMLNECFRNLQNFLIEIFDFENDRLNIPNIKASGSIVANTGTFNNLNISYKGSIISYNELLKRIEALEMACGIDNSGTSDTPTTFSLKSNVSVLGKGDDASLGKSTTITKNNLN